MGLTKERERLLISRIQKDDDEQALKELYYSCLPVIGGTIGEISYETATLRCAADTGEGEDLSGVYYPDAEESELSVCHSYGGIITVTVKEHSEGTVALWKSCAGDFDYSLWLPGQTGDASQSQLIFSMDGRPA